MNPILETALEVQTFCRSRRWRFCFIGAITVQHGPAGARAPARLKEDARSLERLQAILERAGGR